MTGLGFPPPLFFMSIKLLTLLVKKNCLSFKVYTFVKLKVYDNLIYSSHDFYVVIIDVYFYLNKSWRFVFKGHWRPDSFTLWHLLFFKVIDVWILGSELCFIWLSVDVLTSTASILHLGIYHTRRQGASSPSSILTFNCCSLVDFLKNRNFLKTNFYNSNHPKNLPWSLG